MTKEAKVKICGLNTPESFSAALEGGADFVGLVFHPASPRYVDLEIAAYLAHYVPESVQIVGLFVDPSDDLLKKTLENVRLDMIQLHGTETPSRVKEISDLFQKPLIKALPVGSSGDLAALNHYPAAEWLLLDAAPSSPEVAFGGGGLSFDWELLKGITSPKQWMLAGGLTPDNVAEAVQTLRPDAVDVSSGIESRRGVKDPAKILAFLRAAKSAL